VQIGQTPRIAAGWGTSATVHVHHSTLFWG
jgi:hypothetical protein